MSDINENSVNKENQKKMKKKLQIIIIQFGSSDQNNNYTF